MKQYFFLALCLFLFNDLYAQQMDATGCRQFHRGKFSYVDSANNQIFVKRKKNFQVETNKAANVWINFRIKWINDCQYELTQVGTNSRSARKNNKQSSGVLITKILGTGGYAYTCSCNDTLLPKTRGIMYKLNQ
jgi:hypothetical protein